MTSSETEHGAFAPLGEALEDVRKARQQLRDEQHAAWTRYLEAVDRALTAELGEPPTDTTAAGTDPMHTLLTAVRGRVDDLRVQARLGVMEGEDLLEELREALGDVIGRVRAPLR